MSPSTTSLPPVCHLTSVHQRYDVRIFVKQAQSLARAGYPVSLVVADDLPDEELHGVKIISANTQQGGRVRRMTLGVISTFRKALATKAAIFHFHDPELIPVGLLLRLFGRTVIYDVHEDMPRDILSKYWISPVLRTSISFLFERIENLAARCLSAVFPATPFISQRFSKLNSNTVNINNFPLLTEFFDSDTQWQSRPTAIAYAGGITAARGITELIEAMGSIDGELELAGRFGSEELRSQVTNKPGWAKTKEHGFVDRQTLAGILQSVKAGIVTFHPGPNHEDAQPNKLFEYMAAGIPVVASHFPLWRQIVDTYNCGYCVDPLDPGQIAEAVNKILADDQKAEEMGANGRKAVLEVFNWTREEQKLLAAYKNLAEST